MCIPQIVVLWVYKSHNFPYLKLSDSIFYELDKSYLTNEVTSLFLVEEYEVIAKYIL